MAEAKAAPPPSDCLFGAGQVPLLGGSVPASAYSLLPPRAAWLEVSGGADDRFPGSHLPGLPTHHPHLDRAAIHPQLPRLRLWLLSLNTELGTR